jgi:CheY-like chemotaxis protein
MATILAVDEDRAAQVKLREVLENLGHDVHLASSPDAALRVAGYGVPFDLVVLATRMDGRTTGELATRLRQALPGRALAVTGDDPAALAAAAQECGAAASLLRPLADPRAVERELARALERPAPRLAERAAARPAERPAPRPAEPERAPGPIVLVADDNDILRAAMLKVLRAAGLEVHEAASGEDAVRAADRVGRIDLLVTDVVMPGMAGTQLAELLSEERPGLKVLFMSGYTSNENVAAAQGRSSTGVLQKPFRHSVLLEQVQRLLGRAGAPPAAGPAH